MKRIPIVILIITSLILTSCASKTQQPNGEGQDELGNEGDVLVMDLSTIKPENIFANVEVKYASPKVDAKIPGHSVSPDLSNIVNLEQFGEFSQRQKDLLARNGFFGALTSEEQLFYIYENNDYKNLPSFITTDTVMHLYHIFYDYTLRKVEKEWLISSAEKLTASMLEESLKLNKYAEDQKVKDAALKNVAYFTVAARLLEIEVPDGVPEEAAALAEKELVRINEHNGRESSVIFPYQLDYTQFIVRGHYTRSEDFGRFFKAMMWYGQVPFPFEMKIGDVMVRMDEQIIQALLITKSLFSDETLIEEWDRIYSPTAFYVGAADDLVPRQYLELMKTVFGDKVNVNDFGKEENLQRVLEESRKLPEPMIKQALVGIPGGRQFRFMGQRYIADSRVLQELTYFNEALPDFGRPFPKSLDVMSVLGSDRAYDILINHYHEDQKWSDYKKEMQEMKDEFNGLSLSTWQSNLYYGWLWSLKPLMDKPDGGYPFFMQNDAWLDKNLNSASGSWAELRHDTILYGKQSGAECGGGEEPPEPPKGYVEPNVEFYSRLLWLTEYSKENLRARGLIDEELASRFDYFSDMLQFLRDCSVKELANEELTRHEYDKIKIFGAELEYISASIASDGEVGRWWEISSETDRNMAVVADVHTSLGYTLEVGVGPAAEIFVVVPIGGKLYLTRGAIFSYHEFVHPISDRLTDEKWQQMIKEGKNPPQPEWTNSFMTEEKQDIPMPREYYHSGC
jgi:hypothetical protein